MIIRKQAPEGGSLRVERPKIDGFDICEYVLDMGQWRKFAPLHEYIVNEYADGDDNCQRRIDLSLSSFARLPMLYGMTSCLPMMIVVGSSLVALSGGKRSERNVRGIMLQKFEKCKQVGVQFIIRRVGKMTDDILDYWLGRSVYYQAS